MRRWYASPLVKDAILIGTQLCRQGKLSPRPSDCCPKRSRYHLHLILTSQLVIGMPIQQRTRDPGSDPLIQNLFVIIVFKNNKADRIFLCTNSMLKLGVQSHLYDSRRREQESSSGGPGSKIEHVSTCLIGASGRRRSFPFLLLDTLHSNTNRAMHHDLAPNPTARGVYVSK